MPFAVGDQTDSPISLYGATKKTDELIAHAYSFYFKLPTTGLRFFNVYGPRGRPDGAFFIFAK
jgi:UDP-glucuronate 4-epimerase